jgi:hypothetical protein
LTATVSAGFRSPGRKLLKSPDDDTIKPGKEGGNVEWQVRPKYKVLKFSKLFLEV